MKPAARCRWVGCRFHAAPSPASKPRILPCSMGAPDGLTWLEAVNRPAIRALGLAGTRHVQVDPGMAVPELHVRLGAGAVHPALVVEILGLQFNDGLGHVQTLVSQWAYFGLRPLTMSKNALWIFSVMGPRLPLPISMRSSSRIGVTSAAVPVKKASSAM